MMTRQTLVRISRDRNLELGWKVDGEGLYRVSTGRGLMWAGLIDRSCHSPEILSIMGGWRKEEEKHTLHYCIDNLIAFCRIKRYIWCVYNMISYVDIKCDNTSTNWLLICPILATPRCCWRRPSGLVLFCMRRNNTTTQYSYCWLLFTYFVVILINYHHL